METIIGSHVSFTKDKQLLASVIEALSYKANTFMFYTGAPQNTTRSEIDSNLTNMGLELMKKEHININNVVIHAPYIINLANKNNFDFNVNFLKEEIKRVINLKIKLLVLHPGSHVGAGIDIGILNIIDALNEVLEPNMDIIICLETMAGKGSEVGSIFEEIKKIIDGVNLKEKIGVCLDTCHISDASYNVENIDDILNLFDNIIGLSKLKVIHINDSKNIRGSHKDRHENIGLGTIGFDTLNKYVHHEKLKDVPKILETPYVEYNGNKYAPYLYEIDALRKGIKNDNLINDITSRGK